MSQIKKKNVEETRADPLRCPGCKQRYRYGGGIRQPRALGCGHTLCELCIIDKIKEPKSPGNKPEFHCPSCGKEFIVRDASQFPVSWLLVDLLQLAAADTGSCLMHGRPRNLHCISCTTWICQGCTKVNHPIDRCNVQSIEEARSGLRTQQKWDLEQVEETWGDLLQQLQVRNNNFGIFSLLGFFH
ncbi:unnamed protein product [Meganyctiphanes norvegica]|uniref:RING-type domain-containing protein n=1 Tax=Meganyctiphanes norvegica TaxID=48144 RepID=A0AAV2RWM9_MEGNR